MVKSPNTVQFTIARIKSDFYIFFYNFIFSNAVILISTLVCRQSLQRNIEFLGEPLFFGIECNQTLALKYTCTEIELGWVQVYSESSTEERRKKGNSYLHNTCSSCSRTYLTVLYFHVSSNPYRQRSPFFASNVDLEVY